MAAGCRLVSPAVLVAVGVCVLYVSPQSLLASGGQHVPASVTIVVKRWVWDGAVGGGGGVPQWLPGEVMSGVE
ncbi:hypothetical protein E2C01_087473 [Portunus trituberculatus]|uniref:Uncharacterized protein n=1 Tax=Portunus trituberculatus TaxID=210409 RepID=A0A5B7JCK3_PORTR|nr:hypothetical protein [Portunus trituberculatus]